MLCATDFTWYNRDNNSHYMTQRAFLTESWCERRLKKYPNRIFMTEKIWNSFSEFCAIIFIFSYIRFNYITSNVSQNSNFRKDDHMSRITVLFTFLIPFKKKLLFKKEEIPSFTNLNPECQNTFQCALSRTSRKLDYFINDILKNI